MKLSLTLWLLGFMLKRALRARQSPRMPDWLWQIYNGFRLRLRLTRRVFS